MKSKEILSTFVLCLFFNDLRMSYGLVKEDIMVMEKKESYEDAMKTCSNLGLSLIKVTNDEENGLVYDISKINNGGTYWIDGINFNSGNVWIYPNNEAMRYTKWRANFRLCVEGNGDKSKDWNAVQCSKLNKVICYAKKKLNLSDVDFTGKKGTFTFAHDYCKSKGLKLIRINNEIDNNLIYQNVVSRKIETFWIDGNNLNGVKTWVNSNNEVLKYTKWHPSDPDNYLERQFCLQGHFANSNSWDDIECNNNFAIICYNRK